MASSTTDSALPGARLLLPLAALGLFAGLATTPLFDLDEGAFSAATLEMFARGDFLSTYLGGEPRYDKPILVYWLQALSTALLGFSELALRLPSALAALAWAGLAYGFARRLHGPDGAAAAFLVTATALGPYFIGHAATADALLNACLAGALFAQFLWLREHRLRDALLAWLAMGLGFLAKGPVALVVPLGTLALYCASRRDWRAPLAFLAHGRGPLLALAVALPWYVAVTVVKGPGFLEGFFLHHNVDRFAAPMENHAGGPFYYLPVLLLLTLPYTGLLLAAIPGWRDLWRDDLGRYGLILLALVLVLFSLAATKLPHYLLYGLSVPLVVLGQRLLQARSAWLLLPGLLVFALLLVLPDLAELARPRTNHHYQALLANLDRHFDTGYRIVMATGLLAMLLLLAARRLALSTRLAAMGLLCTLALGWGLLPPLGALLQGPIRDAGLHARPLAGNLVMFGLDTPSFSVYAGRVVPRRRPRPGEIVLTVGKRLPQLPPHEVLYRNDPIYLVRLNPS